MPEFNVDRSDLDRFMGGQYGLKPNGSGWTNGERSVGVKHTVKKNFPIPTLKALGEELAAKGIVQSRQVFLDDIRLFKRTGKPAKDQPKSATLTPADLKATVVIPPSPNAWSKTLSSAAVGDIRVSIVSIQPQEAQALLYQHDQSNGVQRRVSDKNVDKIAGAIERGEWMFNGETIVIGENGQIVNGRHRLLACVRANRAIVTLIVSGLPKPAEAFDRMDQHKPRSIADILGVHGFRDEAVLSSTVRLVACHASPFWTVSGVTRYALSPVEAVRVAESHKGLARSLEFTKERDIPLSHSVAAGLHYLCALKDKALADVFFDALIHSEGLRKNEPVTLANHRIVRDGKKIRREHAIFYVVRAWNMTRGGERSDRMRLPTAGDMPRVQ